MISREELELLKSESLRRAVAENIGRDPFQVALDKRIAHASLVAAQVKYLQRAKAKLPSYYAAQCIIPSLAFEQSSSERTAEHKGYSGGVCVDLTCGLGVDSYSLSKRFDRVVALERDPVLADVARYNFGLLGADNITMENTTAEEFLAANPGLRVDMVYSDPDRRSADGRKMVSLSDCSPDILSLMDVLSGMSQKIVVKLSPMFDVDEAFRLFGNHVRVSVVSLDSECKEVLVEVDKSISVPLVAAEAIGVDSAEWPYAKGDSPYYQGGRISEMRYLIVPDVALAKARMAAKYYRGAGLFVENDNSFAFARVIPEKPFGKVYEITAAELYSPKKLRKSLKQAGVKRVNVLKRNFPLAAPAIARELGIAEGGTLFMAFTRFGTEAWALSVEPMVKD